MATMMMLRAMLLVTLTLFNLVNGEQSYCSSTNLGSHFVTTYMYMSNGYCSDACRSAGYSIAVVQYQSCWCSNSVPEDTVSVSNCDVSCPGYAQELCGNSDEGLYGYVVVSEGYSTVGSSTTESTQETTSTTSTESSVESSPESSTIISTRASQQSTEQTTEDTTEDTTSSSSSPTTSKSSSSTARSSTLSTSTRTSTPPASTATTSLAPVTSIVYSVMTVTGSATTALTTTQVISTVISVPSQTASNGSTSASSSSSTSSSSGGGFFDSAGKVAGVFTVVGVVCAVLIGVLIFLCLRHRRHSQEDHMSDEEDGMSHQDEKMVPRPILTPDEFEDNGHGDVVEVDQRLDPRQMMFMNWESGSRQSLADNVDYSRRVLRVTNE